MKFAIFDFRFAIWLIVVTAFVVSGCQQRKKRDVTATEPNIEPLVFIADYASDTIKATAGMDVWMKTKKLELVGVVTIYEGSREEGSQPDNSFYLTEHHFEIYPWLNSIKISAQEPQSRFVWQLSEGRLSLLEGDTKLDVAPTGLLSKTETGVTYRDYADAILNVITAPVRLVDESVGFIKEPGPVKMEGRWYYPIAQTYPAPRPTSEEGRGTNDEGRAAAQPYWSKVVFFQNKDNSLIDMVWFAKIDQKKFLAVRGYDYEEIEKGGILAPTKIEIFTTDARAVLEQRVVKIDLK